MTETSPVLARELGLGPDLAASRAAPALAEAQLRRIGDRVAAFPYYARPCAGIVSLAPWTLENTLLTPTLKLKRHHLAGYLAADIEQAYRR